MRGKWFRHDRRMVFVAWRPANMSLHYPALYAGIYEYLRDEPCREYLDEAQAYLNELLPYPNALLQRDRIRWVREWIRCVDTDEW